MGVWCNPAGMSTQPSGAALAFQTYTAYEDRDSSNPPTHLPPQISFGDPGGVPSFVGAVWQVGSEERPQALGVGFVNPLFLKMAFDAPDDAGGPNVRETTQSMYRLRLGFARDFRFRPIGAEGWLPHLSIGLGADLGITRFEMRDFVTGERDHEAKSEFGGGIGILLGLFDNTRNLKVNLGMAYQSAIAFDLTSSHTLDPRHGPFFNWPDQFQLGALIYLLEGLPLRLTAEVQFVGWRSATEPSDVPGVDSFRRTLIVSTGVEYRVAASESVTLLPRIGLRRFQASWDTTQQAMLPANDEWQLLLSSRAAWFLVVSAGIGVSYTGSSGTVTSFDVSLEYGGDCPAASIGWSIGW